MPVESSRNAKDIFLAAIEFESIQDREAFLKDACGGDANLLERVKTLVAAHESPKSLLDHDAAEFDGRGFTDEETVDYSGDQWLGEHIGPYKLLQTLGEGGMGTVYLAERQYPVKQRVALKVIKHGLDSKKFIARFEAERQALAMMDHPSIAKVLDAGCTESGRPYFVMELVKGVPITQFCDENRLSIRERLQLFMQVCRAVHHAHQKGIIHRDIKPSNVLVALYDHQPVPKVIDFGVAKATGQHLTESTLFTEVGSILGTLEYMSPEQAVLNQLDVDTRTDVYSLGVILYELLTGETPLDRRRLREAQLMETLRMIREDEPPKPSTRISSRGKRATVNAAYHEAIPETFASEVRGDLDWIVMKALAKERGRRYDSVSRLEDDIRRLLANEVVEARPPSSIYKLTKFFRRNKTLTISSAVVVAALFFSLVVTLMNRGELLRYTKVLSDRGKKLQDAYVESIVREAHTITTARPVGYGQLLFNLVDDASAFRLTTDQISQLRDSVITAFGDASSAAPLVLDSSNFEHRITTISTSATEDFFAVGMENGDVSIRSVVDGTELYLLSPPAGEVTSTPVRFIRFAPGSNDASQRLFVGNYRSLDDRSTDPRMGNLRVWQETIAWELCDGKWTPIAPTYGGVLDDRLFTLSARGNAIATLDGTKLRTWNQLSGKQISEWTIDASHSIPSIAVAEDGKQAAVAMPEKNKVLVCQLDRDAQPIVREMPGRPYVLAISQDGAELHAGSAGGLAVHSLRDLGRIWHMRRGFAIFDCVEPSPGRGLVAWPQVHDRTISIWDTSTNDKLAELVHRGQPRFSCFADGGNAIISLSPQEDAVCIWRLGGSSYKRVLAGHHGGVTSVTFSPGGDEVATTGRDGTVRLWDTKTGRQLRFVVVHPRRLQTQIARFSPDGKWLAIGMRGSNQVVILDSGTLDKKTAIETELADILSLSFSHHGKLLAVGGVGGVKLYRSVSNNEHEHVRFELVESSLTTQECTSVCIDKAGSSLAYITRDTRVNVWDIYRQQEFFSPPKKAAWIFSNLHFMPDGKLLFGDAKGNVELWDLNTESGPSLMEFPTVWTPSNAGRFHSGLSPDGKWLAADIHSTRTVSVLDLERQEELFSLGRENGSVWWLEWSPDRGRLAVACDDGNVSIWNVDKLENRLRELKLSW